MSFVLQGYFDPVWQHALLWSLLHTLWQGALVVMVTYVVLRRLSAAQAHLRYGVSVLAMVVMLVALSATLGLQAAAWSPKGELALSTAANQPLDPGAAVGTLPPALAPSPPQEVLRAARHKTAGWTAALRLGWVIGVIYMLLRAFKQVFGAQCLRWRSRPVCDADVLELVDQLREQLQIGRRIRVRMVDRMVRPRVLHVIFPILLLPADALDRPPDRLKVILAHGFSYLRRFDYCVHLLQLALRSILFFNPAVWWLSRQVYIEREVCCRTVAVKDTTDSVPSEQRPEGWPGQSTGTNTTRPASAIARRPLFLSWLQLAMLLLMVGLFVGLGVLLVHANMWAAPERIRGVQLAQEHYGLPGITRNVRAEPGRAIVSGSVHTPDDHPVLPGTIMHVAAAPHDRRMGFAMPIHNAQFRFGLPGGGPVWLQVTAPGYAPTQAGPFWSEVGKQVDIGSLELEAGFSARLKTVDEDGEPIPGAEVYGGVPLMNRTFRDSWIADDRGEVVFEHATDRPYSLTVQKNGYEPKEARDYYLSADEPVIVPLVSAKPTTGIVIDTDGQPVVGAAIYIVAEREIGESSRFHGQFAPLLATTDERGHFTLDTLRRRRIYRLRIEAGGYHTTPMRNVLPGVTDLRIEMEPYTIEAIADEPSEEVLDGVQEESNEPHGAGENETEKPTQRRVIWQLQLSSEEPMPDARVHVAIARPGSRFDGIDSITSGMPVNSPNRQILEMVDGRVALKVPVGTELIWELEPIVGYWPSLEKSQEWMTVPAGTEPHVIEVPLLRAGAVVGTIVDRDGKPAVRWPSLRLVSSASGSDRYFPERGVYINPNNGRFIVTPLPLDATYGLVGLGDDTPRIKLTATRPIGKLDVVLAKSRYFSVQVLNSEGVPVPDVAAELLWRPSPWYARFVPQWRESWTTYRPSTLTDAQGWLHRFPSGIPSEDNRIMLYPSRDYQPVWRNIRLDGKPMVVQLEVGKVIAGRVIDDETGQPVSAVIVTAHPENYDGEVPYRHEAEDYTDGQGYFRISNLEDRDYRFGVSAGLQGEDVRMAGRSPIVRAGESASVELRVVRVTWVNVGGGP